MATLAANSATEFAGAARRASLAGYLTKIRAGIQEGHEIAARYEALSRLSERELAELGMTRDDIPRVAVMGMDG